MIGRGPAGFFQQVQMVVRRYPIAAAAVVASGLAIGGWQVYRAVVATPPITAPPAAPLAPQPATPSKAPVSPRAGTPGPVPPRPGPALGPAAQVPGAASGTQGAGSGQPDPFIPVLRGAESGGAGRALPPVPPLVPGIESTAAPAGPVAVLRLAGIVSGSTALAIVEDGKGSYVVGPGDVFGSGAQLVTIDVRRKAVRVKIEGTFADLTLRGGMTGR